MTEASAPFPRSALLALVALAACGESVPGAPGETAETAAELIRRGKLSRAAVLLERTVEERPDDAEAHVLLGEIELRRALVVEPERHLAQAEAHLRRALAADADHVTGLMRLAEVFQQRGDPENIRLAVEPLERATRLEPQSAEAHLSLGLVLLALSETGAAQESFAEAARLEPDGDAKAWTGLGSIALRSGESGKAVEYFERALLVEPDDVEALANLGLIDLERGKLEAAEERLLRAIRVDPWYVDGLFYLAQVYEEQERDAEALEFYRRTLLKEPGHIRANMASGWLQARLGNHDEAGRFAKRVLDLSKSDTRRASARSLLGQIAFQDEDWERARENLRRAVALDPRRVEDQARLDIVLDRLAGDGE